MDITPEQLPSPCIAGDVQSDHAMLGSEWPAHMIDNMVHATAQGYTAASSTAKDV